MLRLLVLHGHEEFTFALPERIIRLGSAPGNQIVLSLPGISRRHALLRKCLGGIEIVDLDSKNGLLVEATRVARAVLSPGLRVQIGAAWLQLDEVSSLEMALDSKAKARRAPLPRRPTEEVDARPAEEQLSPIDGALALAYHIRQAGVRLPGQRVDLMVRSQRTLGASALVCFELSSKGRLRILDSAGEPSSADLRRFAELATQTQPGATEGVVLLRRERILLAGRESWFLGAVFPDENRPRERWRKDLLRFLARELLIRIRQLDEVKLSEAYRALKMLGGNKSRTATLLDISRVTLDKLLRRRSQPGR